MKKLLILLLLLSLTLTSYAADTLPPMKFQGSYCFFGDAQMKSILNFCKNHEKYAFMSVSGLGEIKFTYFISGKKKSVINISAFNYDTYGSGQEITLEVILNFMCPGNYNPKNTYQCFKDMCPFLDIEPLVVKRLNIVFNKYIINDKKYKNHTVEIMCEALSRANLLKSFLKKHGKWISDYINNRNSLLDAFKCGFYFQLTKKWRLYVFIERGKKNKRKIFYTLSDNTGEKEFIIDLTKTN